MRPILRDIALALVLAAVQFPSTAATPVQPSHDDEVLEILPLVTRNRPPIAAVSAAPASARTLAPEAAARQAREDISVARQTGDTRYWGRAQAVLAPWWDRADAPVDLAVLQATVQQGRHEFGASRLVLTAALARAPGHAQGWLNLAALERLSADYASALSACDAVARAGQPLYAHACTLETQSLLGRNAPATQGWQALIASVADAGQRSWLLSLLAESQERGGRDQAAAQSYAASLAAQSDLYTTIAYGDLLLRTGKPAQALQVLAASPETDAVVLRRAAAWRALGDARWKVGRDQLQTRVAELKRRGDDPALHGRELALAALWLDDQPAAALALARSNLRLQREPIDWWVAAQSAQAARDPAALAELAAALRATGLQDTRLASLAPGAVSAVGRSTK
jgi:hypothetical protein